MGLPPFDPTLTSAVAGAIFGALVVSVVSRRARSVRESGDDGARPAEGATEDLMQSLRDRARHLSEIIDAEPECVKALDADGRLLEMNPAGLRLIEADDFESVAGADVMDLVHPDWRDTFQEMHDAVIAGHSRELVFRLRGLQGTERWMETHAVPFVDHAGRTLHLAITRDITEQKERERELIDAKDRAESANRAKSAFLANMSHELRTPLTAILGYAELLQTPDGDEQQLREGLGTIQRSGAHLLELISDVLDMGKIESSEVHLEELDIDLRELVDEVVAGLQGAARESGIELRSELPADPLLVRGDPTRLRQIAINLVGNAIKFTEEGSVDVELTAEERDDLAHVTLAVRDSGIGMSPEVLEHVFSPFTQADSSTRRRFGGTGLGLPISRELARLMGGEIEATSHEESGSTFELRLALPSAPDTVGPTAPTSGDHALTGRVLLVEDHPVNRRVLCLMLERLGLEVLTAHDGRDGVDRVARERAEGRSLDMVLLDMHMPVMDGFEAAENLRATGYTAPVVALTAGALREDKEKCLEAGCDDFMSKPVALPQLAAMLARHLSAATKGRSDAA